MPTVDVAKIKIRRGSNTDRKKIILDSGELGYTIDTNRVYVGNGTLKGGSSVGTFNFNNSARANISVKNKAEVGDLVFDNYLLYSLSGSDPSLSVSWMRLSPNVDGTTIEYNSDNQLAVLTSGIVTAGNGIDVTGDKVSIDFDTDANTAQMFIPGAGGADTAQLTVNPDGALTNDSHGALNFQTGGGSNHHTLAVAAASGGTAADGFFSKENAQKLWYAPEWDNYTGTSGSTPAQVGGNRTITVINDGTLQINSARLNTGAVVAGNAIQAQAVTKTTGQDATISSGISAVDMMTPWNFFNREDIPGSILRTSIPVVNIDNKGEYANFTITNVGAGPTQWNDKAFLLPGGDGVIYGIFIDGGSYAAFLDLNLFPMVNWSPATYSASGDTTRANIIAAINNITNSNGERIFDAWQKLDMSESTVYIQGLVKGKTPPWTAGSPADSFAQAGLQTGVHDYRVGQTPAVIFSNTATSIDYTGTVGNTAGNGTTGKVGVGMYGWVCMNTQGSNTFQETLCSTGMLAKHTIAQFPETTTPELTNGEYFLIYDANYNRHCVWYRYPETATELRPDLDLAGNAGTISNNEIHRGRKTNFIKVEVDAGRTSDQVASMTYDALAANLEFMAVYTPTWSSPTLTLESSIVGWTDGIIKRQGNFPGCNVPAGAPQIQFISNITGLSGEPDVQSLNAAFYNSWETGSIDVNLPTNGQIFIPQVGSETITVFESNGTSSSTAVGTLLKFR